MWTKEQIEIVDLFTKYIEKINYNESQNYFDYFKLNYNIDFSKLKGIRTLLIKEDFIYKTGKDDYFVRLTTEGNKIAKYGIEKYISEKEAEKQLDIEVKRKTISGYDNSNRLSVIAIICSVIMPILVVILDKKINAPEQESNYNRYYRQEIVDSVVSQLFSDSVFIEKTKYIFKHDTVFLNELKN